MYKTLTGTVHLSPFSRIATIVKIIVNAMIKQHSSDESLIASCWFQPITFWFLARSHYLLFDNFLPLLFS